MGVIGFIPGGKIAATAAKLGSKLAKGAHTAAKACKRNSFVPGTLVLMADGTRKPIEDVKVGEYVLATDPETGRTEARAVTVLIPGEGTKNLVKLTVDTDGDRGDATAPITATDEHPFWVPSLREWTDASELQPGMWLQTSAGTHVQITALKKRTAAQRVHNLTVDDIHTYYVLAGNQAVLVHNTNPDCDPLLDYANGVRNKPGVKFTSEYTSPSGQKYYGHNRHGQQADDPLKKALNDNNHHGGCAEVHCLFQAQGAEGRDAIRGGTMRTMHSRNNTMPTSNTDMHGASAYPCQRCKGVLDDLGIGY